MTKEMKELFDNLESVKVRNVAAAYDFLGEHVNEMDMNGTLDFEMSREALKNVTADYKTLKKYYKGKITINPKSLYMNYPEGTEERFFLECLVKLAEFNKF